MSKLEEAKKGIQNYFKGVRAEWGKITWPVRTQVISETIAVMLIVFAFTLFILILDLAFKGLFSSIKLG